MINLSFDTAYLSPKEASALQAFLEFFLQGDNQKPPIVQEPTLTERLEAFAAAIAAENEQALVNSSAREAVHEVAQEKKPRKAREKKEAVPELEPEPEAEPVVATVTPGCVGLEPPTVAQLREGLQKFVEVKGFDQAEPLLEKFGCKRVSEVSGLTEAKQREFLAACYA